MREKDIICKVWRNSYRDKKQLSGGILWNSLSKMQPELLFLSSGLCSISPVSVATCTTFFFLKNIYHGGLCNRIYCILAIFFFKLPFTWDVCSHDWFASAQLVILSLARVMSVPLFHILQGLYISHNLRMLQEENGGFVNEQQWGFISVQGLVQNHLIFSDDIVAFQKDQTKPKWQTRNPECTFALRAH